MLTLIALPLSVPVPGAVRVGSGFLVAYRERSWLLTAGHLPLMMRRPHGRWNEWPRLINIERTARPPVTLELFDAKAGSLEARFAYIGGGAEPLGDFMALPVPLPLADSIGARRFDLTAATDAVIGSEGFIVGYPRTTGHWPPNHSTTFPVKIAARDAALVSYTPAAPIGTSGGPLVGKDEELLGMSIGFDEAGQAVSSFAIREILDANLARRILEA